MWLLSWFKGELRNQSILCYILYLITFFLNNTKIHMYGRDSPLNEKFKTLNRSFDSSTLVFCQNILMSSHFKECPGSYSRALSQQSCKLTKYYKLKPSISFDTLSYWEFHQHGKNKKNRQLDF